MYLRPLRIWSAHVGLREHDERTQGARRRVVRLVNGDIPAYSQIVGGVLMTYQGDRVERLKVLGLVDLAARALRTTSSLVITHFCAFRSGGMRERLSRVSNTPPVAFGGASQRQSVGVGEASVSGVSLGRRRASFYAVFLGVKPFIAYMAISHEKGKRVKTEVMAWPTRWPLDATRSACDLCSTFDS